MGERLGGRWKLEMKKLKYRLFEDGLVKEVIIKKIKPCIVTENKIRVLMQLDAELEDVIPALINRYPPGKVNYIENKNILTLSVYKRLITLYPSGKISMNKTRDVEEAVEVIKKIMKDINQAYIESKSDTGLDYSDVKEKLSKIGPLTVYNCLPQTDCEKCGEKTCMAFAMKLLSGDATLDKCSALFNGECAEKVTCLEELLGAQIMKTMGWKN